MFTARSSKTSQAIVSSEEEKTTTTSEPTTSIVPIAKPSELLKPEEPPPFVEKPTFVTPKPVSHSPKISPSSIPNPNPSVTTTKQVEPGYNNYGGYIYSVPGYSAFQPVSYPGIVQPNATTVSHSETSTTEFITYTNPIKDGTQMATEEKATEAKTLGNKLKNETAKIHTDFEEQFTPEVIPAVSTTDSNKALAPEAIMCTTSLPHGSGAVVTIPPPPTNKEVKKKSSERFSLKTSIPISKIDMKCVNPSSPSDTTFPNNLTKKPFNPAFHTPSVKENTSKIEIQSNVVIKSASLESEVKDIPVVSTPSNNINTLINAAEVISQNEIQFKKSDPKPDYANQDDESHIRASINGQSRPIFNPMNIEKPRNNISTKPPDPPPPFNETKNQVLVKPVFIQNKNPSNQKMLLTIQQQNPHVLLQRTNFDQKNLQAPSRPSGQLKKCKEELVNENGASSKVVSLKRMHQDNCDENDFENLITENQIYGNKIVVKEKSQGTLQEQDLKNKVKTDKLNQAESKNVVLQPNFVYLSNVQFPANLMMIKNTNKITDPSKIRVTSNENKFNDVVTSAINNDTIIKTSRSQNSSSDKEIHVLKSNTNVLQTFSNKNNKTDLVLHTTNQKVIMNPQIVYQVPMIVDGDNKLNQTFVNGDYPKILGQNRKDSQKVFDQAKTNDKLFITCPYQMDAKLQPKIVITNIRPKVTKLEEVSSIDVYEQRKKLRRLKYLSNRNIKNIQNVDSQKVEPKKNQDLSKNIITPEKMKTEIYKEFANTKMIIQDDCNESDSEYAENDLELYNSIIEEYGSHKNNKQSSENEHRKIEFLAQFRLASQKEYRERHLDRQEKILIRDSVASAYIAAGRIDCLLKEENASQEPKYNTSFKLIKNNVIEKENTEDQQEKQKFLVNLGLSKVTPKEKKEYEKVWQQIVKDRKRRESPIETGHLLKQARLQPNAGELDPRDQLQMLTEIKKHVKENNILIKKRLDSLGENGESIKILAEKNFSELNRLSKMADRSVKHFSGQNTRKRDLNPGFDSENIQISTKPGKYYPNIKIPNISKIIALKTTQSPCLAASTQATSMDEPQNSAAGVNQIFSENSEKFRDFNCQVDTSTSWQGIEGIIKNYKEYEAARKKEITDLHKRNTSLRVESAHITRAASRDSDRARALLAERRNLANEERTVRNSIHWLWMIIDIVKKYDDTWI